MYIYVLHIIYEYILSLCLWRLEIIDNNYELCRNYLIHFVDKINFEAKMHWKNYNHTSKLFPVLFENSLFIF